MPYSICYNNKNLFVADYQNHRVQIYDKNSGEYQQTIGNTGIPGSTHDVFNYPISVCIDEENNRLFVLDYNNHRVEVFSTESGKYLLTICSTGVAGSDNNQLNYPQGICLSVSTGILYVADTKNHRIQLYDSCTGSYVFTFGDTGIPSSDNCKFHSPVSVCIDEHNNYLYISEWDNDRIQILDATTGEFKGSIGTPIKDEDDTILMDEDDNDNNNNNDYNNNDNNNNHDNIDNNLSFKSPYGLCIDRDSNLLYVVDTGNKRIQAYNLDTLTYSKSISTLNLHGSDMVLLRDPREICIDTNNRSMYICDTSNHRIIMLRSPNKNKVSVRTVPLRQPLLAAMASIVNTDIYSDITIVVDGERLPAHRIFLFARSKYFSDILNGNETNEIQETDFSATIMREFLHYLYTDHCTDDSILFIHGRVLLLVAIKYEVDSLIRGNFYY